MSTKKLLMLINENTQHITDVGTFDDFNLLKGTGIKFKYFATRATINIPTYSYGMKYDKLLNNFDVDLLRRDRAVFKMKGTYNIKHQPELVEYLPLIKYLTRSIRDDIAKQHYRRRWFYRTIRDMFNSHSAELLYERFSFYISKDKESTT